jgi:multiple sugar transport system substrate-binding protein
LVTDWATKLPVAIAGGAPPDVVWMDWISTGSYAVQGVIVNLEEIMKRENKLAAYSKDFFPALWETSKTNGQIYALPFDTNNMLMYYNRDILGKYGIPDPDENWTWDDFVKIANASAARLKTAMLIAPSTTGGTLSTTWAP